MQKNLTQDSLNSTHLNKIDILRAIAILCVFLFHAQHKIFPRWGVSSYSDDYTLSVTTSKSIILNLSPIAFGWSGVQLFLIISGFLIHLGFLRNQDKFNIRTFYSKRFWRIYPPYLLILLFTCFFKKAHYFYSLQGLKELLAHIFLVHNLSDKMFFTMNAGFWSLALEVQLYIIYPVFLLLRKKIGMNKSMIYILCFSLVSTIIGMLTDDFGTKTFYSWSILGNGFVWYSGAFLAERYFNKKIIFRKGVWLICLLAFAGLVVSHYFSFSNHFQNYFVTIGWLAFFEWFIYSEFLSSGRLSRALIVVGMCSYSIYLIHGAFLGEMLTNLNMIPNRFHNGFWVYLNLFIKPIVVFIIIFFISHSLYLFVELKAIAFGRRLREGNRK